MLATPASGRGRRARTPRSRTRSTTGRRCSGVVPQHPPTRREAELAGEDVVRVGELGGRERVVRAVARQHRQAGVRHAGERDPRVPGEVAQVLAHLGRAGRAVEADAVDAERLERRERGADLAADQHRAGGLDGDLGEDGQVGARGRQRPLGTDDRGLGLQQVLRGLDQDGVDPALDEAADLLGVGVAQRGVGGVAERGQLGAGPDGARARTGGGRRVDQASAASRAIRGAGRASSRIRCSMPYSPRLPRFAPNVLVSTQSTPTAR